MATDPKKVLLSGIQPSGRLHVGNYFGAMRQFVELRNEFDTYISIVNYHALTSTQNREELIKNTEDAILDNLAIGLDSGTVFLQSDIPEVTELAWIFNTLITVPYLSRAVAYKEKVERGLEPTVGLFDYPVLQAADMLIVDAQVVPIGHDQRQHIEMARDIADKFNNRYGKTFKLPKEYILEGVATVPGIDGQKMSKSYGNTIPLFATDEEIDSLVMKIITDSKGEKEPKDPETDTVFALHRLFSVSMLSELHARYTEGSIGYKESKEILARNIKAFVAPLREKRMNLEKDRDQIHEILDAGKKRVRKIVVEKMERVRRSVGVSF